MKRRVSGLGSRGGKRERADALANGLVGHGELGKVVAGHLGLDLDSVEDLERDEDHDARQRPSLQPADSTQPKRPHLAVVDSDDRADHLGDDDHVTEVGLDGRGLLVDGALLLGLAAATETTPRPPTPANHHTIKQGRERGVISALLMPSVVRGRSGAREARAAPCGAS